MATLSEVKAVAEELLEQIAGQDLTETDLFPYGVNRMAVRVRAGECSIEIEMEGPDHPHTQEDLLMGGLEELDDDDEYDDDDEEDEDDEEEPVVVPAPRRP